MKKDSVKKEATRDVIEGTLVVLGRGGGIVKCEKYPDGIRVYEENMNRALHNDEVKVRIVSRRKTEIVGAITEIVLRTKNEFTGTLVKKDGENFLKPASAKMYVPLYIPQQDTAGAEVGDRVYGVITTWNKNEKYPSGKIIKVLGKTGEHEAEMQAITLEYGFAEDFEEGVLHEAKIIKENGIQGPDLIGRKDFRNVVTFTIDPFDAKDFDDAISVAIKDNGDAEIGIHIADVSHYVALETELDREALERGTSVYLVDRTIPMLPRALSDDLCSLLPNVDRLTMSTVVTFDKDGKEKSVWFGPTVIHSAQRFTYEEAQEILDGKDHTYKKEVLTAATIARGLGKARMSAGALVLDQEEVKILLNDKGETEKIVRKIRTESHTLIEELMLLANRKVAEYLENGGANPQSGFAPHKNENYSVIYRIHEKPSAEKAEDLAFFMRSIGYPIQLNKEGSINPKEIGRVLKEIGESNLRQTVLSYVIRSMSKAIYSTNNLGHYGLQFSHYTHFTSPIRRYPDLVIHRLMRETIAKKPAPASLRKKYERIARLCSMAEIRAAEAERESIKLKLVEYMSKHIGETFDGVITGIAEWGIYVKEKETTAEGLIGMRSLGNEAFRLDPRLATLTGENSKRVFRIGDTIQIRLVRADPERRQIDYEIISG